MRGSRSVGAYLETQGRVAALGGGMFVIVGPIVLNVRFVPFITALCVIVGVCWLIGWLVVLISWAIRWLFLNFDIRGVS